jgi:hypothetical protein
MAGVGAGGRVVEQAGEEIEQELGVDLGLEDHAHLRESRWNEIIIAWRGGRADPHWRKQINELKKRRQPNQAMLRAIAGRLARLACSLFIRVSLLLLTLRLIGRQPLAFEIRPSIQDLAVIREWLLRSRRSSY